MTCQEIRELLDDALDARLEPDARAAFDVHLRQCGSCSAEWELAASVRASLLRIGLDPAPPGMKESIGASVRRLARSSGGSPALRKGETPLVGSARRFGAPAYARAAAAVLVIVTIGWLGWEVRSRNQEPAPAGGQRGPAMIAEAKKPDDAPERARMQQVNVVWNVDPVPAAPEAGLVFQLDARTTTALVNAREIAAGGPGAAKELNRIVTGAATPEHRQRQAEVLLLLRDNMSALANAAGETDALSSLGRDADETLAVFSGEPTESADKRAKDDVAAAALPAARPAAEEPTARAEEKESALKVTRAASAPRPFEAQKRLSGEAAQPVEPAFYMVSGPGAIGRVEKVLADRGLRSHQVWLTERPANEKTRKREDREADYRIIEVEVPESGFAEMIGELESLVGLRLAPVGRLEDLGAQPSAAPVAKAATKTAPGRGWPGDVPVPAETRGASEKSRSDGASNKQKSLSIRKLRLVLIGQ